MIGRNKFYADVTHGYTGHVPSPPENYDTSHLPLLNKAASIPGYAGHVPKVVSENVHGISFGKTMKAVQNGKFEEPNLQETLFQSSYKPFEETTAAAPNEPARDFKRSYLKPTPNEVQLLVGRHRRPLQSSHALLRGSDASDASHTRLFDSFLAQKVDMQRPARQQSMRKNLEVSACDSFASKAIAGYAGHQRQLFAANVFGKTYRESIRLAAEAVKENARQRSLTLDTFLGALQPRGRARASPQRTARAN